jgi:hypothetical protein
MVDPRLARFPGGRGGNLPAGAEFTSFGAVSTSAALTLAEAAPADRIDRPVHTTHVSAKVTALE